MGKFKTTTRQIKEFYYNIIGIGYCNAQYLLYYKSPIAYNSGVYGWNFDLYNVNGVAICTGYRNIIGERIDYSLLKEYENKARAIVESWGVMEYAEKEKQVNALLDELINKVLNKQ